ncbi:MAG: 30S ribosome-binding factor RbfA, partial [Thermomicrobiales bacterium]
ITTVEVPPDLRSAQVFVSVLGTDKERDDTLDALRSAARFIRFHLKPRLRMRQIPVLEFRDDRSMEYAQQITATLREIKANDAARDDVPSTGSSAPESTGSGEPA